MTMRKSIFAMLLVLMLILSGCSDVSTAPTKNDDNELVTETEVAAETESTESFYSSESKESEAPEEMGSLENMAAPEETDNPETTVAPEKVETEPPQVEVKREPEAIEPPAATVPPESQSGTADRETTDKAPAVTEEKQKVPEPFETQPQTPPEETEPKTAYDFEFDIEAIKADCIGIGQGMGLSLDSSLTPSNAAWWNPITASQSNQGEALKQSLESYITFHTAENLGSYGMDEITAFNIYCEARGNGVYSIYFLFA